MIVDQTYVAEYSVLGIPVQNLNWNDAFAFTLARLSDEQPQHIFAFLNANNANIAMEDVQYRETLNKSIVLPDGLGVEIATKMVDGHSFLANLNGTDFIPALMVYADKSMTVALIGGQKSVVERAAEKFSSATPWHNFVVISDGYFDSDTVPALLERLAEVKPDIILIGMGSPIQEKWVEENIKPKYGKLVFTVGALFDFVSRRVARAPEKWRKYRLEWLYRLLLEPRRLWRRYIIGNPLFIWNVIRYNYLKKRQ